MVLSWDKSPELFVQSFGMDFPPVSFSLISVVFEL